jgi:RNA polymerase sigma factor for flagellar operon FliA
MNTHQHPMSSRSTRPNPYQAAHNAPSPIREEATREALIEAHFSQVRYIAERLAAKLPPSVECEDLIGAGMLGLLDAVDKFDASRGVMFKTYAEMRVRGAMLDSLRDLDWAPRSLRRRGREVEEAYVKLEQEKGRPASEEEVAAELRLSVREFQLLLGDLRGLNVSGLEVEGEDEAGFQIRQVPDNPAHSPHAMFETAEKRDRLAAEIDRLPERERQIVALYYLEELTMKEIGAVLGVTESRVSQIHTQAVLRLRAALTRHKGGRALAY